MSSEKQRDTSVMENVGEVGDGCSGLLGFIVVFLGSIAVIYSFFS